MSKSARLRLTDLRAVYQLAGECRDLGDDVAAWQTHAFRRLAQLVDADLVIGGEQADLSSGRTRILGTTDVGWENGFDRRALTRAFELHAADPTFIQLQRAYLERRDWGRALRRAELRDDRAWRRSLEYNVLYRPAGVDHPLVCFRLVPAAGEEVIGAIVHRAATRPDFTPREAGVVTEAFAVLGPLVGGPLARFADPSPADLPPRVRQVLRCLLEGDAAKQIAARLGISLHTVNQYVKVIFKHFGVQGRPELTARWVRRGWGRGFAWADE